MATKLVKCTRVVTYCPSLRSIIIKCRAFSSASDKLELLDGQEDIPTNQTVWPDHTLGPLGPKDMRFLLPGSVGLCVNTRRLTQDLNAQRLPQPVRVHPEAVLPPVLSERHVDVLDQFLVDTDEIEIDFEDQLPLPGPSDRMEYRAHSCPQLLRKDFQGLFPDRNILEGELTVITVSLKTEHDMTTWSSEVEEEREMLLDTFVQGALGICQSFEEAGFWADFVDPSSGKPFKGPHTNFSLFETDERYRRLGFDIQDMGCCKVVSHPIWGTHVYIGSLFTTAPVNHMIITSLNQ